jgi:hypothetical protein
MNPKMNPDMNPAGPGQDRELEIACFFTLQCSRLAAAMARSLVEEVAAARATLRAVGASSGDRFSHRTLFGFQQADQVNTCTEMQLAWKAPRRRPGP